MPLAFSPYLTWSLLQIHTGISEGQVRSFETLNKVLATRTYLVGERITLADLAVGHVISRAATVTFDETLRAKYPHTVRHMETIINHPKLKDVFGEIKYVDKPLQYVPPPKEKKESKPASTQAPKEEKPKPAKAQEPKAKPKPEEEDDDDDEPLIREEPKQKNPLDLLPKSSFNLEDWKRAYSNKETKGPGGSLEWFYEQ
jgi:elongation factor 1-gamma